MLRPAILIVMRIRYALLLALMLFGTGARPQGSPTSVDPPPAYQPEQQVTGVIRTWGHGSRNKDYIGGLIRFWEADFRKYQPKVEFDTTLLGEDSAIGGLYTGAADIAILERGLLPIETDGYQPVMGHNPAQIAVATGSLDLPDLDPALVIVVNRDNPLSRLSLAQVDAIFGADHRRGPENIRTWGELGLTGAWAAKPIRVYVTGLEEDAALFFEKAVMGGSQKWTGNLKEFTDPKQPTRSTEKAAQRLADALAKDRYGIGLSTLIYKNPGVKPLALAVNEGGPYHEPSRASVASRAYPLTRTVSVFFDRAPGQPIVPKVREYLRFILSEEGQSDIVRDGQYFPLTPELLEQERGRLK